MRRMARPSKELRANARKPWSGFAGMFLPSWLDRTGLDWSMPRVGGGDLLILTGRFEGKGSIEESLFFLEVEMEISGAKS
jgi:hypothetical protein